LDYITEVGRKVAFNLSFIGGVMSNKSINKDSIKMETWELLQKKMIWQQLTFIKNKKVLDYGSGEGFTANHFAADNEVVAIEPSEDMINKRIVDNQYTQIMGSLNVLKEIKDNSYDIILCHNVLEYTDERSDIIKEFSRILKNEGTLSIVKHNRSGRVMQMTVLLNNFDHANDLLDGKSGIAQKYGAINYYNEKEILEWSDSFLIKEAYGIRTFWALQQKQDIQKDVEWQEKMLSMELRVCNIEEFKAIASFHHLVMQKKNICISS